jgi:organic radical activating enzyme
MRFLDQILARIFKPAQPLPAGIYHYQTPADTANPMRMHLRLENNGEGVLIINASTVLHLNQTAAEFVYHFIQGASEDEISRTVANRYQISQAEALKDYRDLKERLEVMTTTQDLDPVTFLNFDRHDPYSQDISAPYRLDCAITYRVSGDPGNLAPVSRVSKELTTEEWKAVLKKAWDAGIPHVVFTGGEPTLRDDLPELIAAGEELGQVTGLLTDGLVFTDPDYLHTLLLSGLDHMMFLLDPYDDNSWSALNNVLAEDIFTTVHLTISSDSASEMDALLDRIVKMGVSSISLSAKDPGMKTELDAARQLAAEKSLQLVWDLPVPYSNYHPVALELAEAGQPVSGAGKAFLYVEPDGDVLIQQGIPMVMGNLLTDSWESIWEKRPQAVQ